MLYTRELKLWDSMSWGGGGVYGFGSKPYDVAFHQLRSSFLFLLRSFHFVISRNLHVEMLSDVLYPSESGNVIQLSLAPMIRHGLGICVFLDRFANLDTLCNDPRFSLQCSHFQSSSFQIYYSRICAVVIFYWYALDAHSRHLYLLVSTEGDASRVCDPRCASHLPCISCRRALSFVVFPMTSSWCYFRPRLSRSSFRTFSHMLRRHPLRGQKLPLFHVKTSSEKPIHMRPLSFFRVRTFRRRVWIVHPYTPVPRSFSASSKLSSKVGVLIAPYLSPPTKRQCPPSNCSINHDKRSVREPIEIIPDHLTYSTLRPVLGMSKLYFLNHQQEELTRFYLRESKQLPGLPDRGRADYLLVAKYEQRK